MKVNEILTEKAVKMKPADAWAHVEKVKSMLAKGQMTQQQLDGAIKQANSIEDSYWKSKAQKLDAKWEGAEWWELAKKMYPIVQTDDGWKVTSTAKGWKDEKSWTLQYKAQAMEKVQRLVKWLDQNRKRGFGDKDEDVARLAAKFAAEDKKEPEEVHEAKKPLVADDEDDVMSHDDVLDDIRNNVAKSSHEDIEGASAKAKKHMVQYRRAGLKAKHALYQGIDAAEKGWTAKQVKDDIAKNVR